MTRRACISGAGSGIGRQTAIALAEEGADLVLLGRRSDALHKTAEAAHAAGATLVDVQVVDLRNPECVVALRETVQGRPFDIVIATAGGNAALADDAPDTDGVAWATWHWSENFRSNILTAVHLVEGLREVKGITEGASIVLFSSIAAYRGSGSGSYAGSKAALHPYAYDLASTLSKNGVRVNVVAPGYIADTEFFRGGMTQERHDMLAAQALNGRPGVAEDVAAAVVWLCGPGARHVTGQVLQINGGANLGR